MTHISHSKASVLTHALECEVCVNICLSGRKYHTDWQNTHGWKYELLVSKYLTTRKVTILKGGTINQIWPMLYPALTLWIHRPAWQTCVKKYQWNEKYPSTMQITLDFTGYSRLGCCCIEEPRMSHKAALYTCDHNQVCSQWKEVLKTQNTKSPKVFYQSCRKKWTKMNQRK